MRKGINSYVAANAYGNAAAEDFTREMDRASSKPVAEVIASFVRNAGLPLITATSVCEAGNTKLTLTQQRFFSDPEMMAKPSPELWTIPVCFRDQCELLRQRTQTFAVKGCDPVYLNRNARGYYITQYEPDAVLRLAAAPSLTPFERYALLREDWLLVRAGRRDVADFMRVANALRGTRDPRVLQQLTSDFQFIGERLTTPENEMASCTKAPLWRASAPFSRSAKDATRGEARCVALRRRYRPGISQPVATTVVAGRSRSQGPGLIVAARVDVAALGASGRRIVEGVPWPSPPAEVSSITVSFRPVLRRARVGWRVGPLLVRRGTGACASW